MNVRILVVAALAGMVAWGESAGVLAQAKANPAARLISITVGDPIGEKMEYGRKVIVAKPGERLKVQLVSVGVLPKTAMAHNWVLLKPGTDAKKFADAAALARDTDFIPPAMKAQVIAFTGLAGAGERVEVTFVAPTKPGTYRYICTFAGHFAAGMFGDLIVK